jgi:hypothetical protein
MSKPGKYPPRLQKSLVCRDGKRRRDCVCVIAKTGRTCGKPIVGTVPFLDEMRLRLCQEHYDLFTNPPPYVDSLRVVVPEGAGSVALRQLVDDYEGGAL